VQARRRPNIDFRRGAGDRNNQYNGRVAFLKTVPTMDGQKKTGDSVIEYPAPNTRS
jgi:hypothetical protein